jgi:hypothetical protein
MENVYLRLTADFNEGRHRAMICGGQAVVLHRLAVMSKDGDWILREDDEALRHVLAVLGRRQSRYRFGAPLDLRWMAGGWSAHLEHHDVFRVRTDFFTRPPRLDPAALKAAWEATAHGDPPVLPAAALAQTKRTNREKDYVVIGELARIMNSPAEQLLHARSARDLVRLAGSDPALARTLATRRPLLAEWERGEDHLARLLDEERRDLVRRNERRLARRLDASREWAAMWPALASSVDALPLAEAHEVLAEAATGVLPFTIQEDDDG